MSLLERLDRAASTLVPLLYLAGLALGTLAYFTDVRLGLLLAVGIALSVAAELHSFLVQRRTRGLYAQLMRAYASPAEDDVVVLRRALLRQFWISAAILLALVAFSTYNSVAFVAATWTPAPGWLPDGVQVGIRGGIIPALFLLAGFLAPLHADPAALLETAAHDMLRRTVAATTRQWRKRVRTARRQGVDLAPVAVALLAEIGDAAGARRLELIAEGLAAAEAGAAGAGAHISGVGGVRTLPSGPSGEDGAAGPDGDDPPPSGPGVPGIPGMPGRPFLVTPRADAAEIGLVVPVRTPRTDRRARASGASWRTRTVEGQARAAWRPGMSVSQLQLAAGISRGAAAKWRKVLLAEGAAEVTLNGYAQPAAM